MLPCSSTVAISTFWYSDHEGSILTNSNLHFHLHWAPLEHAGLSTGLSIRWTTTLSCFMYPSLQWEQSCPVRWLLSLQERAVSCYHIHAKNTKSCLYSAAKQVWLDRREHNKSLWWVPGWWVTGCGSSLTTKFCFHTTLATLGQP